MWSAYSVPRMTSLSKPAPPSTETGAFMLYSTWFVPAPVRMSLSAAVEKPLVSFGIAIWSCALIQTIRSRRAAVGVRRIVGLQSTPVVGLPPFVFVCASAKPRTMNRSLPSSPSSRSGAWFE